MKTPRRKAGRQGGGDDLLDLAGRDLADAAESARKKKSSDAEVSALKSLVEVCLDINSIVELGPLLTKIVDQILLLSGTERGFVMLYESDGDLGFVLGRTVNGADLGAEEFHISMSTAEAAASNGKAVYAAGPEALRAIEHKKSVMELELKTIICVPLRTSSGTQGVLYADSRSEVSELTAMKREIVNSFADQVAVAIERAKRYDDLQQSKQELERKCDRLSRDMKRKSGLGPIIGRCDGMLEVFDKIGKVAPTESTVLVEGDTGTGKELVARTLHDLSPRRNGPFEPVVCGAIPEGLVESELFGYMRGAFTGATTDKPGRFEIADGGTIFLDEISEIPLHLQVKLLRFLQEGELTRLGSNKSRAVDVRVISATNKKLEEEMENGRFRSDLYYRLKVVTLSVPPLRERGSDILLLAQHFLEGFVEVMGRGPKRISQEAAQALLSYSWPGNVRELEHMMEQAAALGSGSEAVTLGLLGPEVAGVVVDAAKVKGGSYREMIDGYERLVISEALARSGGNVPKAAAALEVSKQHLYNRIKKLEISRDMPGED
jgi:transcriptional regulator with GAF, ATPase, and Fis domain